MSFEKDKITAQKLPSTTYNLSLTKNRKKTQKRRFHAKLLRLLWMLCIWQAAIIQFQGNVSNAFKTDICRSPPVKPNIKWFESQLLYPVIKLQGTQSTHERLLPFSTCRLLIGRLTDCVMDGFIVFVIIWPPLSSFHLAWTKQITTHKWSLDGMYVVDAERNQRACWDLRFS